MVQIILLLLTAALFGISIYGNIELRQEYIKYHQFYVFFCWENLCIEINIFSWTLFLKDDFFYNFINITIFGDFRNSTQSGFYPRTRILHNGTISTPSIIRLGGSRWEEGEGPGGVLMATIPKVHFSQSDRGV